MLIPRLRKGSVKSISCSLCAVIVRAATAKSAIKIQFKLLNKINIHTI